ncbi:MAG: hypothetical protein ACI83B_001026 [Sediminicola sp.]|jgi:hypothetical protein
MGAGYITGYEVLSRMTNAAISYEFAKYMVIVFLVVGMFYRGFHRKSWPYILFILLLVPGIIFSAINLNYGTNVGDAIGFNLSGPICLAFSALYCFGRKIPFERIQVILMCILLPLVTTATHLFFVTPDLRDSLSGTGSNFAASGGYGPNQVATVLGMGMFILFTRLLTVKNKMINITDFLLLGFISYRAIVTFSRGGVITAAVCAGLFLLFYGKLLPQKDRAILVPKIFLMTGVIALTWLLTVFFSSGLIVNRYSNEDAAGKLKKDITTGRTEIIDTELAAFYENPITGVGVGKAKEYREQKTGIEAASHNETSRMLSEHGLFGLFGLLVLLLTPLLLRIKNRNNVFFYSFLAFWFLTINHSSMRIAAPAFIYGLSLINITYTKKA